MDIIYNGTINKFPFYVVHVQTKKGKRAEVFQKLFDAIFFMEKVPAIL